MIYQVLGKIVDIHFLAHCLLISNGGSIKFLGTITQYNNTYLFLILYFDAYIYNAAFFIIILYSK